MKRTMIVAAAMMAWGAGQAAGRMRTEAGVVRVDVYYVDGPTVVSDSLVMWGARSCASSLLADAGIQLVWHGGKPSDSEQGPRVIGITFTANAPTDFEHGIQRKALASAHPYGAGATISVYDARVKNYLEPFQRADRPKVLGHVLAHEIVHVLEGIAVHSTTGLMKAEWTELDRREITGVGLRLADDDRELIRMRFAPHRTPVSDAVQ
jgi:hypothetical protein